MSNSRGASNILNKELSVLNQAWIAQEMVDINHVINAKISKMNQIANTIEDIERDIRITEQEIRREDEAAAAAAREKERIEKEKLEKELWEKVQSGGSRLPEQ